MGKMIAVVSGKGGTGKTSLTANVGMALAYLGYSVLCMDCDVTLRNLDLALNLSDCAMMDFYDVATGRCALEAAVIPHDHYPNLHLLTAPQSVSAMKLTQRQLAGLAETIRENYDFCLIDAPAGLGLGFHLATACADSVIVVTTPDISALRDAQRTVMDLDRFPRGAVHLVVGRVQKKLLRRSIPPLTTPLIWQDCRFWALSRRTRWSPGASAAEPRCGSAVFTQPAPMKISPDASQGSVFP